MQLALPILDETPLVTRDLRSRRVTFEEQENPKDGRRHRPDRSCSRA